MSRGAGICNCGGHCWFEMTRGLTAFADAADFDRLVRHRWRATVHGYAETGQRRDGDHAYMHHVVLGQTTRTDHRDGNEWNNRSANLRPSTHGQNMRNRRSANGAAGFKGVTLDRRRGFYRAELCADGKRHYGSLRLSPNAAARDYDALAIQHHGAFALTNAAMGLLD